MTKTQKAYNDGFKAGAEQGRTQGALAERRAVVVEQETAKLQATIQLLQQAGQFQECITKLVMSINNHL